MSPCFSDISSEERLVCLTHYSHADRTKKKKNTAVTVMHRLYVHAWPAAQSTTLPPIYHAPTDVQHRLPEPGLCLNILVVIGHFWAVTVFMSDSDLRPRLVYYSTVLFYITLKRSCSHFDKTLLLKIQRVKRLSYSECHSNHMHTFLLKLQLCREKTCKNLLNNGLNVPLMYEY